MGMPAGASLAFFIASSNFFARMSSLLVSWNQESANLSSRWRFCSARIFWASVRSTLGPALTGTSYESTAPKTGSTVNFAWQHGHVTWRFSPERFPIAGIVLLQGKKVGARYIVPLRLPKSDLRYAFAGFSPRVKPGAGRSSGRTSLGSAEGAACGGGGGSEERRVGKEGRSRGR